MKLKWDQRVYIDLYAGSGLGRIKNSSRYILGSPLIALTLGDPFDKYIFCEDNSGYLNALRQRVKRLAPDANVKYITGDCNLKVDEIIEAIPAHSPTNKVLALCFVDPFDLGIKFQTLEKLSRRFVDFLCLLALHMDANRNYTTYINEQSHKVDEFLGTSGWRQLWSIEQQKGKEFPKFLAEQFAASMQKLRYKPPPYYKMKEVKYPEKNVPLYRLALFSRNDRAYQFWDEVLNTQPIKLLLISRAENVTWKQD
jgi:three-Cys-motif partner protein